MVLSPDYSWRQCSEAISLTINLHRQNPQNVDVVSTDQYLKVSFPPYLLEVFLEGRVTPLVEQRVTPHEGTISVRLEKAIADDWRTLGRRLSKPEASAARRQAEQQLQDRLAQQGQEKTSEQTSGARRAVSVQLKLDQMQRDSQLQTQKQQVLAALSAPACTATQAEHVDGESCINGGGVSNAESAGRDWDGPLATVADGPPEECAASSREPHEDVVRRVSDDSVTGGGDRRRPSEEGEYDGDGEDHYSSPDDREAKSAGDGGTPVPSQQHRRRQLTKKSTAHCKADDPQLTTHRAQPAKKVLRSPRSCAPRCPRTISVHYTQRHDSLPARKHRDAKEAAALEAALEAANVQFSSGDYSSCVTSYSSVLAVQPDCVRALSNRAAAHLAAGNHHLAVQDINKALSVLSSCPADSSTDQSRLLCLSRRCACYTALGEVSLALCDAEAALALRPDDPALLKDCESLRRAAEGSSNTSEGSSWVETEEEDKGSPNCPAGDEINCLVSQI